MKPVVVVTGMAREAQTVRAPGLVVIPGGGDAQGLARRLEAELPGARAVLSYGMGGALAPGLALGDWVIGTHLCGALATPCDPALVALLAKALPTAHRGPVYADGTMIAKAADKAALHAAHGALAVDMESHIAARLAAAHGLPFAVVRCISDEAGHTLPPAITCAMRPDGGLNGGAMALSILRQPGQIGGLVRMGRAMNRAMQSLREGGARIRDALQQK